MTVFQEFETAKTSLKFDLDLRVQIEFLSIRTKSIDLENFYFEVTENGGKN